MNIVIDVAMTLEVGANRKSRGNKIAQNPPTDDNTYHLEQNRTPAAAHKALRRT